MLYFFLNASRSGAEDPQVNFVGQTPKATPNAKGTDRMNKLTALGLVAATLASSAALAGPRDQAFRMHSRLAGVPPKPAVLDQMETLIKDGKVTEAAMIAIEAPQFYNLTLRNWTAPWTNEDMSVRFGLNDYSATVIGMIRDGMPFNEVLTGDFIYVAKDGITGVPVYSALNNDHYAALDNLNVDLKSNLEKRVQTTTTGLSTASGVMTTRAFGDAFYNMGTNRLAVRTSFMTFLCNDMEHMHDTTIPDFRIRRDVDRAPGGDPKVFRNKCAGCHAGMDGFAGAFAHVDFEGGRVVYDEATVRPKMNINATNFPDGYVVTSDGWVNMWSNGQNKRIGWNGATSGDGIKSYGQMLVETDEFPKCVARRVYSQVCLKDLATVSNQTVATLADEFKSDNYNVKNLFAKTAAECMGD